MKTPWLVVCWMIWVALAVANPGGSDDSGLGKLSSSEQFSAEAVQACNGLQDGTGCRFAGQEQLGGVCRSGSQGEPPVCVPTDPASPIGGLSPEAIRVCNGIPHGTECHFTEEGSQVNGNCRPGPPNSPSACVPSRLSQSH